MPVQFKRKVKICMYLNVQVGPLYNRVFFIYEESQIISRIKS